MSLKLTKVIAIARQAGQLIVSEAAKNTWIQSTKDNGTPVTSIDTLASEFICEQLRSMDSSALIISEEGESVTASSAKAYWLIDPLDGTRGFIDNSSEYCINIALIEAGVPVLGVAYAPVFDDLYYAEPLGGATRVFQSGQKTTLRTSLITRPWRMTHSRYFSSRNVASRLNRLEALPPLQLNSALKFSALATNQAQVYLRLGPTCQWDTAAGQCILTQAGGVVVDLSGKTLQYSLGKSLINPAFLAVSDERLVEECLSLYQQWRNENNEHS